MRKIRKMRRKKKEKWWKEEDKQGYRTMMFIVNSLNVLIGKSYIAYPIAYPSIYIKRVNKK